MNAHLNLPLHDGVVDRLAQLLCLGRVQLVLVLPEALLHMLGSKVLEAVVRLGPATLSPKRSCTASA